MITQALQNRRIWERKCRQLNTVITWTNKNANPFLTGCICMPQNIMVTQNHRFSSDLHHWTPLGRGLICQNIFGLRTVHMGETDTPIFRLTKQNEHTLWRIGFSWDSLYVNILWKWKKSQNFRLCTRTVHHSWQKLVQKINFLNFFFANFQYYLKHDWTGCSVLRCRERLSK